MPGRRPNRIVDPATHQPREVCLSVAAEFLGCHPTTVRRRIDKGFISAVHYGNVYKIPVDELAAYKRHHTEEGIFAA